MKNSDMPAMPNSNTDTYPTPCKIEWAHGITKREHFAGLAMQGLIVNAGRNAFCFNTLTVEAIRQADLLLVELDK